MDNKEQKLADVVWSPPHYTWLEGVEVIDITEQLNFNLGNAVKYILRCDHKHEDSEVDLNKAAFYVEREIARRKRMSANRPTTKRANGK